MSAPTRYYTAVVTDNEDPDELGRLRVICPELYGDGATEIPSWVAPRVYTGAAAGAGWWFIPPVDSIVFLEASPAGDLRWSGGTWGQVNAPPDFLTANYPHRSGFTSPEGGHALALDDDVGFLLLVTDPSDPDGPAAYQSLDGAAGEWKVGLPSGALLTANPTQVALLNAAGDALVLDVDNGVTLIHQDGAEFLALTPGVTALAGADVQIKAGSCTVFADAITFTDDPTGVAPTHALILGPGFLTDLNLALPELMAASAALGLPVVNTTALIAAITASLGAGAPYLSTITSTK